MSQFVLRSTTLIQTPGANMNRTRYSYVSMGVIVLFVSFGLAAGRAQSAAGIGDIVQTTLNGQDVIAEVVRIRGNTADLNIGQNNVAQFVDLQYVHVLQKAGGGGKSTCAVGESVQVPYIANTVLSGRIMKTNGAYCQIDSSGSGFTGWKTCAQVRRAAGTACG